LAGALGALTVHKALGRDSTSFYYGLFAVCLAAVAGGISGLVFLFAPIDERTTSIRVFFACAAYIAGAVARFAALR
jgi:hypothetical protein